MENTRVGIGEGEESVDGAQVNIQANIRYLYVYVGRFS